MPPVIFVSPDGRTEKKTPIEHIHYILQPSIWYTDMRPMVSDHNKALAKKTLCLNDPKTSRWAPTNYKWDYKIKLLNYNLIYPFIRPFIGEVPELRLYTTSEKGPSCFSRQLTKEMHLSENEHGT